jgi:site-specific recombinase XerD
VIAGAHTPEIARRVEDFFHSVASIFEAWVNRRKSDHTRRAYRGDVMAFVEFRGWAWPKDSGQLLRVSILDVQSFREDMLERRAAPKTMNRRISSLSSFYSYLAGAAAELRLPITVPNPAHAQFIARESSEPVDETRALSETRARQLMGMPSGDSLLELRDRAILKFYLYTGARIATAVSSPSPISIRTATKQHCAFISKAGDTKPRAFTSARRSPSPNTSRRLRSIAVLSSALAFRSIMKRWLRDG